MTKLYEIYGDEKIFYHNIPDSQIEKVMADLPSHFPEVKKFKKVQMIKCTQCGSDISGEKYDA